MAFGGEGSSTRTDTVTISRKRYEELLEAEKKVKGKR